MSSIIVSSAPSCLLSSVSRNKNPPDEKCIKHLKTHSLPKYFNITIFVNICDRVCFPMPRSRLCYNKMSGIKRLCCVSSDFRRLPKSNAISYDNIYDQKSGNVINSRVTRRKTKHATYRVTIN